MFLDNCAYYLPIGSYGPDGRLLILSHEAAVTLDIGAEDSGKLTFKVLCGHVAPLMLLVDEDLLFERCL